MVTRAKKPSTFKVVLLGEGRVGKTSLLLRYVHGVFDPAQPASAQAGFLSKEVSLPHSTPLLLSIWDTAGQERFRALGPIYYRDAHAAVLVYDVMEAQSLERVRQWVAEVRLMGPRGIALLIAANKTDLLPHPLHPSSHALLLQGQQYAREIGALFVPTSAKLGSGVSSAFAAVASEVVKRAPSSVREEAGNAPLANRSSILIVEDGEDGEDGGDVEVEPVLPRSQCCS